jgi:predicted Zn-dependent peptidase
MRPSSTAVRDIEVTSLSNGIRIITEAMPAVRSVAIGVWVGTGSRNETLAENGISHFIEHMLFKGSSRRSAEDIARECDSIGGHLDAFTGKELVGFNMKVIDDHVENAFDILSDLLLHPRFDAADVEKEKGVVLEELKMDKDSPESQVHETYVAGYWVRHALGRPILGTRKTIQSFAAEALRAYHARNYHTGNLTITAAGSLEHEQLLGLAERYFAGAPQGEPLAVPAAPETGTPFVLKHKRSLHQVHFCVGSPMHRLPHPFRFASFIMNVVLGGSMSSRLFQNVRERRGLVYNIGSDLNLYRDSGCLGVYGGTSLEKTRQVVDLILAEFTRLKSEPVPEDELRRAKDHMKGSMMLGLESTGSRMSNLARQWLYFGRYFTLDELVDSIEAVRPAQIQEIANEFFLPGRIGVSMLGNLSGFQLEPSDLTC